MAHCIAVATIDLGGSSTPEPSVLIPQRSGGTAADLYLQDSVGQITDSGSPDYNYPDLRIDTYGSDGNALAATDEVGTPYLRDAVTNTGYGTVVGLPATERATGLDAMGVSDGVTGIDLSACEAILIEFTHVVGSVWYALRADTGPGDGWSFKCRSSGRISFETWVSGVATPVVTMTGITNGTRWAALMSRTASGTYGVATFAMDGTVNADNVGASAPDTGPGILDTSLLAVSAGNSIHRVRGWTSALSIAGATAVLNGSTTSGWSVDLDGLLTGVRDPADATRLIYSGGAGSNPVVVVST